MADKLRKKPVWDPKTSELSLCGFLVKRFRWPAPNQVKVLKAFAKQRWRKQIDDPLPHDPDICSKRRLHDTIKCLNRNRTHPFIKFHGDGTGTAVIMEIHTGGLEKALAKQSKKAIRKKK